MERRRIHYEEVYGITAWVPQKKYGHVQPDRKAPAYIDLIGIKIQKHGGLSIQIVWAGNESERRGKRAQTQIRTATSIAMQRFDFFLSFFLFVLLFFRWVFCFDFSSFYFVINSILYPLERTQKKKDCNKKRTCNGLSPSSLLHLGSLARSNSALCLNL